MRLNRVRETMKTFIVPLNFLFIISSFFSVKADEIDEDQLFLDTNIVIDSSQIVDQQLTLGTVESTHVGLSGSINSVADIGFSRDYFNSFSRKQITPSAYVLGNLLLDIRLPNDVKAFANVETNYKSDSSFVKFSMQELFIDANIKRKIYFRTGKQVLQWGRCFFWNPTDLINIERKSIEPQIGYREGVYGVKMHIPFGTRYNVYGFIDMNKMASVDSIAGSFRTEMLLGTTEAGAELWGKRNKEPVFGIDFSTSIYDFEITGELSLESGKNHTKINIGSSETIYNFLLRSQTGNAAAVESTIGNKPVSKICLGISKSFDLFDIKDRIKIISEFYFNQAGVPGDFFHDHKAKESFDLISKLSSGTNYTISFQDKLISKFYHLNDFSRYYISLFATVNRFVLQDMVFQFNAIMNIEQKGAMLISSLQYTTLHNLSIGIVFSSAVGSKDNEYTVFQNAFSTRLNLGISF